MIHYWSGRENCAKQIDGEGVRDRARVLGDAAGDCRRSGRSVSMLWTMEMATADAASSIYAMDITLGDATGDSSRPISSSPCRRQWPSTRIDRPPRERAGSRLRRHWHDPQHHCTHRRSPYNICPTHSISARPTSVGHPAETRSCFVGSPACSISTMWTPPLAGAWWRAQVE